MIEDTVGQIEEVVANFEATSKINQRTSNKINSRTSNKIQDAEGSSGAGPSGGQHCLCQ